VGGWGVGVLREDIDAPCAIARLVTSLSVSSYAPPKPSSPSKPPNDDTAEGTVEATVSTEDAAEAISPLPYLHAATQTKPSPLRQV
jgi:hypothetical protein